jgi:hypothetical protein
MATEKKPNVRPTQEPLSKRDIYITRFAVGAGAVGLFFAGGGPAKVEGGIDAAAHALYKGAGRVESVLVPGTGINTGPDVTGVPGATMDYLKSLPTARTEIPEGGGIDDAAYAVDPETFDESPDIRSGVEEIIADEVSPPGDGNFIVPAHAKVDVPVVPPLDQVPPEAR